VTQRHPEEWLVTEAARERPRPLPARTRRRYLVFALVGALLAFVLGLALGQALEEGGKGSGAVTYERTLDPVTVAPPPRTVTVSP
jgi:hypothetical protein